MVTQWASANTILVADGKLTYWEEFESDDVDAAIARFEELTAPGNAASRSAQVGAGLMGAGDIEALQRDMADDFILVDHRAIAAPIDSVEMGLAPDVALVEQGVRRVKDLIAWRGDRVALLRVTRETDAGFPLITYIINQLDSEGLGIRFEIFDEDSLDEALRRVNELWWAGEGAEFRASGELFGRLAELVAEGAWDDTGDLLDPEFKYRLSKTLLREQFDIEGWIESTKVWRDLAGSIRFVVREVLRATTDAWAVTQDIHAVNEGTETQWSMIIVLAARDGKIISVDEFDPDDEKGALARFEELAGG
jgi:hypothetical protein